MQKSPDETVSKVGTVFFNKKSIKKFEKSVDCLEVQG